jgi:hypothetical protein
MAQIGTGTEQSSSSTAMIDYLGDEGPDGACIGKATTSLRSFFGATPVAQQSVGAVIPTTGVVTGGVFSTSTLTVAFVTQLAAVVQALKNLGISS